jgi:hypothetical protein
MKHALTQYFFEWVCKNKPLLTNLEFKESKHRFSWTIMWKCNNKKKVTESTIIRSSQKCSLAICSEWCMKNELYAWCYEQAMFWQSLLGLGKMLTKKSCLSKLYLVQPISPILAFYNSKRIPIANIRRGK